MQMDNITETEVEMGGEPTVETNPTPSSHGIVEVSKQTTKEAIQWLEQGLGFLNRLLLRIICNKWQICDIKVYDLGAAKSTNEEGAGSRSQKQ